MLPKYGLETQDSDCIVGILGRPRDGLYEPALADTEREAVADLLQYLENVRLTEVLTKQMTC